jgi:negative regulator of flagellin synthesis FlgM
MKVENSNLNPLNRPGVDGVNSADRDKVRQTNTSGAGKATKDRATLSSGAQIMAKAMAAYKEEPEVRSEKLEALRQQIVSGDYQIPYDGLAKKLISKIWNA